MLNKLLDLFRHDEKEVKKIYEMLDELEQISQQIYDENQKSIEEIQQLQKEIH